MTLFVCVCTWRHWREINSTNSKKLFERNSRMAFDRFIWSFWIILICGDMTVSVYMHGRFWRRKMYERDLHYSKWTNFHIKWQMNGFGTRKIKSSLNRRSFIYSFIIIIRWAWVLRSIWFWVEFEWIDKNKISVYEKSFELFFYCTSDVLVPILFYFIFFKYISLSSIIQMQSNNQTLIFQWPIRYFRQEVTTHSRHIYRYHH